MDCQGSNLRDFLQTNGHIMLQRVDNNYGLRYFTENEIQHITNGYSTMLGKGAFGQVYKGTLDDHSSVAVKRYIHGTRKEDFAKEVIVHSQINHKNVVRLLGCCTEENALMIVMEFISNGNLYSILHCSSAIGHVPFPLDKRLDIAIEVAEVLWCMHSMYSPVLHGDIKPENILLDENLTPKISDFGIARLLCANGAQHTINIIGSIGYLDPAYCESGILTPKSDVYSFGVVLLEIITRKKAVDGTIILTQCFNGALEKGEDVLHMFDAEINDAKNMKFLRDIGKLAAECLRRDAKMRPEMIEVAISLRMIRNALQGEQGNPSPINSISSKKVGSAAHQFGNLNIFEEDEMKKMTRNYSMAFRVELREHLYNGVLGNGHPVIVEQLRTRSETDREMFLKTMSILSRKNHRNVVNVVGFHLGKSVSECVYESCSELSQSNNGSLSFSNRNLYETICSTEKLPLHLRLLIAVQCAEGLVHIHSYAAENPDLCGASLLGNFRSANIFLDRNFVPKVFNANLSTFLGLSVMQRTNIFAFHIHDHGSERYYLDPSNVSGQLFNPKSDVYSFGVVLLELITWKTVRYMSAGTAHILTTDFLDTYRSNRNAIDIFGKVYDEQGRCFLHEAIAIAIECLQLDLQKRPEISDVLSRLRIIASAQSIRSKLTVGRNNEPSHVTAPTPVNDTAKTLPTALSNISLEELNKITRNFSSDILIGQGSYARVFIGVLRDGRECAVKNLYPTEKIQVQVPTILGMCKHDNVVQLLGYYVKGDTRILAYEYASRGSLHDILHGKRVVKGAQPGPPLSWLQRVKIAISAAKGLEFLHEKAKPPVIHTNIKSSNIFLFDDDVAKIGDLGVSKELTPNRDDFYGYDRIRPQCVMGGEYRKKSDIYSFGVVLLELLTGRTVGDPPPPHRQQNLVTWAIPRLSEDKVKQCIDPRLGGEYPPKAVAKMAAVAALCLQYEADFRPEMSIVVKALCPLLYRKEYSSQHS
ncbi:uncharacterized protein LOC133926705 isoform X2 [Phragmites australis]|uniref:uncharacterized protein LOC133926705 isoform X2 n=1 Tax=Phragmites australis TaxID=29695 RepID=UPI002D781A06|nr:uncharacterized protein LOC133926705 isoform X2 [Phragmites australis]